MESHLRTGIIGEEIASRYLEGLGWQILERNWRFGHKEVDLIAQWGDEIIFVEVKTRRNALNGRAVLTVDKAKEGHLIASANAYVRQKQCTLSVRYDVIGIDIDNAGTYAIEHIPRAFYPRLNSLRRSGKSLRRRR